jgi:aminoglycoside phosphotransferase (APT) family kinase protein
MTDVSEGLARWLSEQWGEPVSVSGTSTSSTGARRQNVLFDATGASRTAALVATITPSGLAPISSVEAEAAVRTLAEEQGVPTPPIRGVCTDDAYVGGPFFLSERVDGETIPRQIYRLAERTGIGVDIIRALGAGLARLHQVDVEAAATAMGRDVLATPVAAALGLMRQAVDELLQPEPALSYGLRWLEDHAPAEPDRVVLLHGDARVGNLIVDDSGLQALLDWEGARIGDPMEDPAWTCIRMWRFGNDALIAGGLAGLEEYASGYESGGGTWDPERLHWWRVCATLRWAVGLAGQVASHLDGSVRNVVMAASGRRVPELEWDLLSLTRPD